MQICIASLRQGLWAPTPIACIQDAFFALLKRWARERQIKPSFWNVSWEVAKPKREDGALARADVLFLFSSNEFTFHGGDAVNPLFIRSSNERVARVLPLIEGKRVVLFSSDAQDTERLIREGLLRGISLASLDVVSEADFPLSVQTVRFGLLAPMRRAERDLDFAYWGTTKAYLGPAKSGDPRQGLVRAVLMSPSLKSVLIGNHFGPRARAAHKFDTNLGHIGPELARARSTWCFQWPGFGSRLTARYIEALALGLVPFCHSSYDTPGTVTLPWQRKAGAGELIEAAIALREPEAYRARYGEAREAYLAQAPSDAAQYGRLLQLLAGLGLK